MTHLLVLVTVWLLPGQQVWPAIESRTQHGSAIPIFVDTGQKTEPLGQSLIYSVREELRRSAGFSLADSESTALARLTILTLDLNCADGSTHAAASVVLSTTGNPQALIHHEVWVIGRDRIADTAKSIIAAADQRSTEIRAIAGK